MEREKRYPGSAASLLVGLVLLMTLVGPLAALIPFMECPNLPVVNATLAGHRLSGDEDCALCGGRSDPDHHHRITVLKWCFGMVRN